MKIGKQSRSALIYPKDINRLAADAGLGAALARARIPVLAGRLLEEVPRLDKPHPTSESVAALITERCEDYQARFTRK